MNYFTNVNWFVLLAEMNLLLLLPLFSAHLNPSLDELIHTDGLVSSDGTQAITHTLITMFKSFVLCVCVRALRPHKIFKINTFKTCNILFKMILWQGNSFHITGHVTVIVKLDCHIKFIDRSTKGGARGRLNKKDGLTRYGNSHVKDKTS